jgi:membrane associated rhomboid family serine protease
MELPTSARLGKEKPMRLEILITLVMCAVAMALMPIGDDNEGRLTTPYVTYVLIAINVAVFVFLQLPNPNFTYAFAAVPLEIIRGVDLVGSVRGIPQMPGPQPIQLTLLSAMFMHGGWMHLLGNMLYLWIFGDNIEDALGHAKFLVFYLVCGLAASAAHIFFEPGSIVPSLGASGAIAGVLGAYLRLYPTRQVRVLVSYLGIVMMPAILVIGFWAALQFMNGFGSIARTEQTDGGGVAYMAHVGGFVAGLVLIALFGVRKARDRAAERMTLGPPRH